ncbi:hypothetical protein N752_20935 [Desulforamulus aquiferis]|nr:hypothetical protein N752_20935 [Desulforamulus aquiferis]
MSPAANVIIFTLLGFDNAQIKGILYTWVLLYSHFVGGDY